MEVDTTPEQAPPRAMDSAMEVDTTITTPAALQQPVHRNPLALVSFVMMTIGAVGGPLVLRAYFLHGGNRKWLSSFLQTAGWPLLIAPLSVSYIYRRRKDGSSPLFLMSPWLLAATAAVGVTIGVIDLLYAYGLAYLPVSTSSILISMQLVFTAVFALLVVRHPFTAFSVNAVVLLTLGAATLGLGAQSDRPEGVSRGQYYVGFAMTIGSAALYGLVLPVMEISQTRLAHRSVSGTYTLVVEMQFVIGLTATVFCIIGMIVNHDFQAIPSEAKEFGLGQAAYYLLIVGSSIVFQFLFLGTIGAIFYGSALLAGVITAVLLSITEVFAVLFFHERFNGTKGVALALSLWGFASYFYGEIRTSTAQRSDIPPNTEQHLGV